MTANREIIIYLGELITDSPRPASGRSLPLRSDPFVGDRRGALAGHLFESDSTGSAAPWLDFDGFSDLSRGLTLRVPNRPYGTRQQSGPLPDNVAVDRDVGSEFSSSLPSSIGDPLFGTRNASSSSSLLIAQQSSLLNHDNLDVKVIVRRDSKGRLIRGTLAGLVDELLHPQGTAFDVRLSCDIYEIEQDPLNMELIRKFS